MKVFNRLAGSRVVWAIGIVACVAMLASSINAKAQDLRAYDNFDLTGSDLRSLPNTDLQTCSAACQADNRCRAIGYNKWTQQCSLKAAVGRLRFEPRSLAAVSGPTPDTADSPWEILSLDGQSLDGTAYSSSVTPTYDQCMQGCRDDPECIGLSYATQSRMCKLYQTAGGYSADESTYSGIKHQVP